MLKTQNSAKNSEYGPGARYTMTNRIGCTVFHIECEKLRTRLSNELKLSLGLGLINKLESKMAATPPPRPVPRGM